VNGTTAIRNLQREVPINTRALRRLVGELIAEVMGLEDADLGISLVSTSRMRRLNESFLRHAGPTDVITFNYSESKTRRVPRTAVNGEIFICPAVAVQQAREFRTTWPAELARYAIHGILHLRGYDDTRPAARRRMKREENRLLREMVRRFPLRKLAADSKLAR
jgi:probable rRNA maturation factor